MASPLSTEVESKLKELGGEELPQAVHQAIIETHQRTIFWLWFGLILLGALNLGLLGWEVFRPTPNRYHMGTRGLILDTRTGEVFLPDGTRFGQTDDKNPRKSP